MELSLLASMLLVLVAIYFSWRRDLGLEKQIALSALRAMVQLVALGFVLGFIFKAKHPLILFTILLFMVLFAAYTAQKRIKLADSGYKRAFVAIFLASFLVICSMLLFGIISFKPNEIIPLGGMIIGNSLNVYTLAIDRLKGEIKNNIAIIEAMTALGADLKEALFLQTKTSFKAAMIPPLNTMQTVGIIHIPGIATGMLIAGADPMKAVLYQIAIMYMILAVSVFSAMFAILLGYDAALKTVLGRSS